MGRKKSGGKQSFGQLVSGGIGKVKELGKFVVGHWNKPPEGKSLPFKEWAAYCVGGMGVSAATVLPTYLTVSLGLYIAAALNFTASSIMIVITVTSIVNVVKSPFIGMLVDNTKSKYGKFRPYLMWMPIPIFLTVVLIGWVPYAIQNYVAMVVVFTILYNLMQIFMGLYTLAFTSLIQVISPSPEERTGLMSIGSVIYSLGPSVVSFLLPMLAGIFTIYDPVTEKVINSGLNMIGTYHWIIPAMTLVFLALGYWTAFGTKERVVVSKKYVQKVKFFTGIKQTVSNKYFWINLSSNIISIFRLMCTSFTAWICLYMIQSEVAFSVANVLLGMAYIPGMLFAPLIIKKFGKKKLVLITNFFLCLVSVVMIFFVSQAYILLVFSFFAIVVNSVRVVVDPMLVAQYYDYQQFKTGNRLEGFLSQFAGMIGAFFAIFTGLVSPAIGELYGYTNDNTVLYDNSTLSNIIRLSLIIGAASALLGAIPYFFWDLSEKKHRQIMDVLAIRAKAEDGEIPEEDETTLETRILSGEEDVISSYFHLSEDKLLAEAVDEGEIPADPAVLGELTDAETEIVNPTEGGLPSDANDSLIDLTRETDRFDPPESETEPDAVPGECDSEPAEAPKPGEDGDDRP